MTNWDDAQFVLALARSGTIRAAAKSLGVNHTTVSRRIATLEKQLSARLFELTPSGYVMTVSGKIICKAAEEMEDLVLGSHRRVEGADAELSGEVHIHIPDIFDDWVCDKLTPFLQQHTKLQIHLSSSTSVADMAHREADIALRFTDEPPEDMVGMKVCSMPVAVYASKNCEVASAKDLTLYPWVRWAPMFAQSSVERWTEFASKGTASSVRVTSYKTLTRMISNNAGIGCLTPWFAEGDKKLKRITPDIKEAAMDVWVLMHPDLRGVRRIKVLKDLLVNIFEGQSV